MAAEPIEWRGVVAVQYGTVILADADGATRGLADPDGIHRVLEQRCGPSTTWFWPPFPTTEEGEVTSIWQDPTDGSRWASGHGGTMGHPFLQELAPEEAAALEIQGFPPVQTFARDADGRIWGAFDLPLERAPGLRHIQSGQRAALQQIYPPEQVNLVDIPAGWSRITRRNADGTGPAELVDGVRGDGTDGVYVRWRDGSDLSV